MTQGLSAGRVAVSSVTGAAAAVCSAFTLYDMGAYGLRSFSTCSMLWLTLYLFVLLAMVLIDAIVVAIQAAARPTHSSDCQQKSDQRVQ